MQKQTQQTVPLRDRNPEEIRAALKERDLDPKTVDLFVRLHAYAVKNHLGMGALAHQVGVSQGTLSPIFAASYIGDYDQIAQRVEAFFWRLEQKERFGGLRQFVETDLARALWMYFEKTRITRRIQPIESPEQVGKTRCAVEYTSRNNSGRTVYVKVPGGLRSGMSAFIWSLAEALGLPYTLKLVEKRIRIRQVLESCDLLIIDEFHVIYEWSDPAIADFLDYLRTDLHDDGKRGVVLISTNSETLATLTRFARRARHNLGQLIGRMRASVIRIDPEADITHDDVRALTARYYEPGAATLRHLHNLCITDQIGHFGLLEDVLNEAWTRAKAKKRTLDDTVVEAVLEEVKTELNSRKNTDRVQS